MRSSLLGGDDYVELWEGGDDTVNLGAGNDVIGQMAGIIRTLMMRSNHLRCD